MEMPNLKYIVFLLDAKFKSHDGKVVSSLEDARNFVHEYQAEKWATQFIIGSFVFDENSQYMNIHMIETYGFKNDKKQINQLTIFIPK